MIHYGVENFKIRCKHIIFYISCWCMLDLGLLCLFGLIIINLLCTLVCLIASYFHTILYYYIYFSFVDKVFICTITITIFFLSTTSLNYFKLLKFSKRLVILIWTKLNKNWMNVYLILHLYLVNYWQELKINFLIVIFKKKIL